MIYNNNNSRGRAHIFLCGAAAVRFSALSFSRNRCVLKFKEAPRAFGVLYSLSTRDECAHRLLRREGGNDEGIYMALNWEYRGFELKVRVY